MQSIFKDLTNKFSLSKTLRFELRPYGETAKSLDEFKNQYYKDLVERDTERAEDYKIAKKLIDKVHQDFINSALAELAEHDLKIKEVFELYKATKITFNGDSNDIKAKQDFQEKRRANIKEWEALQKTLRKQICKLVFSSNEKKNLFGKELIEKLLPEKDLTEEERRVIANFKGFTTYFTGFNQNRENIYKDEGSTAISFRIINDNLPKYFENIIDLEKIKSNYSELFNELEREFGENLQKIMDLDNYLLFTSQDGISVYNSILGTESHNKNHKDGVNQRINLFKQKNNLKINKLKPLFSQILSDKDEKKIEVLENDQELFSLLRDFDVESALIKESLLKSIENLESISEQSLFIKKMHLQDLSLKLFKNWSFIKDALIACAESKLDLENVDKKEAKLRKKDFEGYKKELEGDSDKPVYYSFHEIEEAIKFYISTLDHYEDHGYKGLKEYFMQAKDFETDLSFDELISENKKLLEDKILILNELNRDRRLPRNDKELGGEGYQQVKIIQDYLNGFMNLIHYFKPLNLVHKRELILIPEKDATFYDDFEKSYKELEDLIIPVFNKVRNYVTKKPYNKEKVKINFDNGHLLNGWSVSKERDNLGTLFLKDGKYFLGIINKKHNKIFDFKNAETAFEAEAKNGEESFEKVFYYYIAGPNKMLPKVFFAASNLDRFQASDEILRIRNHSSFTKGGDPQKGFEKHDFNIHDCHKMIDFYKDCLAKHEDWAIFKFKFKDTSEYNDISEFYKDISDQAYQIKFSKISKSYIEKCVDENKLFLFEIYNKDFSIEKKSKGKDNLHTMYWKEVFEPWLRGEFSAHKLNGEAEIFYRPKSLKLSETTIHKKGERVDNKNPLNPKSKILDYEIIKDRRFTQDKFFLHVPISLNHRAGDTIVTRFNDEVNSILKDNPDINIIGIDRGEKNLLYYTVINQSGTVLEQNSLNVIKSKYGNDQTIEFDYKKKLQEKEDERLRARKFWGTIENIKEIKSGYLSHVIHKLATLVLKYNAIVVLEDLNLGFKQSRIKVEKQVYQKFEHALIEKLNLLTLKDESLISELGLEDSGKVSKPLQLAPVTKTLKDIKKQTGILFYVNPAHTSKIDPLTGFVNLVDWRYKNMKEAKSLLSKFDDFYYDSSKDLFIINLDYKKLAPNKKAGNKTEWQLASHGEERFFFNNKTRELVTVNVNEKLKELFDDYSIDFKNSNNLLEDILFQDSANFYSNLLFNLRLLTSLRHSDSKERDFILSPVHSKDGFFDSEKIRKEYIEDLSKAPLPVDSDANGAYHIALKGLYCLEKINEANYGDRVDLTISNDVWFNYAQEKARGSKHTDLISK